MVHVLHAHLREATVGGLDVYRLCMHHLQHPLLSCPLLWRNGQTRHGVRHFYSMHFTVNASLLQTSITAAFSRNVPIAVATISCSLHVKTSEA